MMTSVADLTCGVPQGPILGPILFSHYMLILVSLFDILSHFTLCRRYSAVSQLNAMISVVKLI